MLKRGAGHSSAIAAFTAARQGSSHGFEEAQRVMKIEGGCHCGAVRFEAEVPQAVEVLDCNCSICAMTGFRHLIVPHTDFRLIRGEDALTSYRFGTGAAEHLFCRTCGVKSFYQPRSHPDAWSVNLNALDDPSRLSVTARAFDGRNWERSAAELGQAASRSSVSGSAKE